MGQVTDKLQEAIQMVKELEDQVTGSSPLAARLDKDRQDLEDYAQKVLVIEQQNAERAKELAAKEAELADKSTKLDELKKQLSALQKELTGSKKSA